MVPKAMILVSDQRLTDARTGRPVTDQANKAIADTRGNFGFAYTGIASIRARSTLDWIMDAMVEGQDPMSSLTSLRNAGNRDFAGLPVRPSIKRLAVVGSGWAVFSSGDGEPEPFLVCVSNFDGGDKWLDEAQGKFKIRWFFPQRLKRFDPEHGGHEFGIWTAGQNVPHKRQRRLIRQLENNFQRTDSLTPVARAITEEFRSLARVNSRIGKGMVVISIPHPADIRLSGIGTRMLPREPRDIGSYFDSSLLRSDSMSFMYVPPDPLASPTAYGPAVLAGEADAISIRGVEFGFEEGT
jgi:hypothetical protein